MNNIKDFKDLNQKIVLLKTRFECSFKTRDDH